MASRYPRLTKTVEDIFDELRDPYRGYRITAAFAWVVGDDEDALGRWEFVAWFLAGLDPKVAEFLESEGMVSFEGLWHQSETVWKRRKMEPGWERRWNAIGVYAKLRRAQEGSGHADVMYVGSATSRTMTSGRMGMAARRFTHESEWANGSGTSNGPFNRITRQLPDVYAATPLRMAPLWSLPIPFPEYHQDDVQGCLETLVLLFEHTLSCFLAAWGLPADAPSGVYQWLGGNSHTPLAWESPRSVGKSEVEKEEKEREREREERKKQKEREREVWKKQKERGREEWEKQKEKKKEEQKKKYEEEWRKYHEERKTQREALQDYHARKQQEHKKQEEERQKGFYGEKEWEWKEEIGKQIRAYVQKNAQE
ncbi:hypothetical protein IAT38_005600 [Cryptococcus sp. DSM 104549]